MIPSTSQGFDPVFTSIQTELAPSSSLNFLTGIATSGIKFESMIQFDYDYRESRLAGVGAYSTVQRGLSFDKQLVALKHSRPFSGPFGVPEGPRYEQHLHDVCLELRILSHEQLRKHKNILDILGVGYDTENRQACFSLILEYSSFGTLHSFLSSKEYTVDANLQIGLITQFARGLAALHSLAVCHGDVKTQNALIFQENDTWILKISDFGTSIIADRNNQSARVRPRGGTRLLSAPEIRRGIAMNDPNFDIHAALATDVFSFGLLAWEVLNRGRFYFDRMWVKEVESDRKLTIDDMEEYLDELQVDGLLEHAKRFLETLKLPSSIADQMSNVFDGSLRDSVNCRQSIDRVLKACTSDAESRYVYI